MKSKSPPDRPPPAAGEALSWPRRAALWLVGAVFGQAMTWFAAIWIGAAGLFLAVAWGIGPQQIIDAARYAKFTGQVSGTTVESWLAVELDVAAIRNPANWRASAFASPCALIEYQGDWSSTSTRRAFCGNRLKFSTEYTLAGVRELAPKVPFGWQRDGSGFIVPELRVDKAALDWLVAHPVADGFMHREWHAISAYDELRLELDEPVDAAIAGWTRAPGPVALAFDPQHPEEALPSAVVAARLQSGANWVAFLIAAVGGLIAWFKGMSILPLVAGLAAPARWVLMVLPLASLPWWGAYFPRALAQFNAQWAMVVRDMFADVDRTGRFVAFLPGEATLENGVRLVWDPASSAYADTLGSFELSAPSAVALNADAALASLASTIAAQVGALDPSEQAALFSRLKRDVDRDLDHAAIVFFPAARDAILARRREEMPAHAAHALLAAWSNRQHSHAQSQLAQEERERLQRAALDLPWQ